MEKTVRAPGTHRAGERSAHGRARRWVLVREGSLPGRGRVPVLVELPLLALPRRDRLGVQAVRRHRAGEARAHRGRGRAPRRRPRRAERHALRSLRLAPLLRRPGGRVGARRTRLAPRSADAAAGEAHLRRLEGAVVRDHGRPAAVRGARALSSDGFTGRTAWARSIPTPLREFLRTETGGAAVLLGAAAAALVWVNADAGSYERVWSTRLAIDLGRWGVALDLRDWVNSGLMTFFFFVVGLEARREFDLGELRERRRFALPILAGCGGALVAIGIYLAFNAGRPSAHGWGVAMSTDTAFALGLLALVGPRFPDRLRTFMLTVVVVDDVVALVVIAAFYSGSVHLVPLAAALGFYAVVLVLRSLRFHVGLVYF